MARIARKTPKQANSPLLGDASVVYRSLADQIAASIRAAIAQGRIPPGTRLLEPTLAREMGQAAQRGEYARLVELDYQFHARICRASGNRTLYETWLAISGKVRLYLAATNLVYPDQQDMVHWSAGRAPRWGIPSGLEGVASWNSMAR